MKGRSIRPSRSGISCCNSSERLPKLDGQQWNEERKLGTAGLFLQEDAQATPQVGLPIVVEIRHFLRA